MYKIGICSGVSVIIYGTQPRRQTWIGANVDVKEGTISWSRRLRGFAGIHGIVVFRPFPATWTYTPICFR